MSQDPPTLLMTDTTAPLRRSVYFILILLAFGMMTGHIIGVERVYPARLGLPKTPPEPQPTHADNDRSRWATIRALVEKHTYVIGVRAYFDEEGKVYEDQGQIKESGWGTIDKVLHPDIGWRNDEPITDENQPRFARYYYSSKPPLLPSILAGEYWLIHQLTGWTLTNEGRWAIVRLMLFTVNALPWFIALILSARLIEQLGSNDLARIAGVAAMCFCTYVNAFASTLNNHTIAAWSVIFAVYPVLNAALRQRSLTWLGSLASGFWAAWTVANELPAAAFAGLLGLWILVTQPRLLVPFLLGVMPVLAGFLLTNYLAIGTIVPAYEKFGTEWYNYPGSFWHPDNIKGIDKPRDSTLTYLFHLTFGHHGLFSLTPVLLLALFGLLWPRSGMVTPQLKHIRSILGWGTLALSLVILGFYLSKTQSYNYGGWTVGPRWFIWLTPLWILGAVPILDALAATRLGRGVIGVSLGWSALSVAFSPYSPWLHPWLYRLLEHLKIIDYT
ncbi:MAG TPA: hypothetical protein PLX97_06585 [Gemmatales bacterium]|nr:hypothetical protein [Gemmatales bacterium]